MTFQENSANFLRISHAEVEEIFDGIFFTRVNESFAGNQVLISIGLNPKISTLI
jgi:hypothetical protein